MINVVIFFISYTLLRIYLFCNVIIGHMYAERYWDIYGWRGTGSNYSDTVKWCYTLIAIFFSLIILLNFFWYSIIIKGICKLTCPGVADKIWGKHEMNKYNESKVSEKEE